jgi:hypothetical protein
MQGNPFYIEPMGGYGPSIVEGLSGLGSIIAAKQEEKRKKAEQAALMQEAQGVFESNDPMQISQFYIKAPEFAKRVQGAVAYKNEATEKNMVESMQRILAGEDPAQVITERAQFVQSQGGDPIDTLQELDVYRQDPQGYAQQVARSYALMDPQGYTAFRQAMAPIEGEKLTGNMANTALAMFGTADVSRLTSEQRQQVQNETQRTGGGQTVPAKIAEWQKYQELKRTDPEGAMAFGQAAGFVDKNGKMSTYIEKQLGAATDEAVESEGNVGRFNAFADQVEQANFSGGVLGGKWAESFKDITGTQDAVTDLRKRYNAIRGSQVVNNLPPGAASDTDIALALSGFPSDNAGSPQIASFLRGIAKLEQQKANFASFKADFIANNKSEAGLLKAWKAQTGQGGGGGSQSPGNFSESDFAAAAKQVGVSVEEFRKIVGQ